VVILSVAKQTVTARALLYSWSDRPALIGLASGAAFGMAAVSYRAASLSLGGEGFLMQAGFTLACVTVFQTVVMAIYMIRREPGQLGKVIRSWRVSGLVGLAGMGASVGWFTAVTIQNAAYVRALGQIELVFTFVASVFIFRERTNAKEVAGILLIVAGILVLLALR
jgi:drug/metabolite transporter (DMT)-like permease